MRFARAATASSASQPSASRASIVPHSAARLSRSRMLLPFAMIPSQQTLTSDWNACASLTNLPATLRWSPRTLLTPTWRRATWKFCATGIDSERSHPCSILPTTGKTLRWIFMIDHLLYQIKPRMQHLKAGQRFGVLLIRYRHIVDCQNDVRSLDDAGGFDDALNRRDCGDCSIIVGRLCGPLNVSQTHETHYVMRLDLGVDEASRGSMSPEASHGSRTFPSHVEDFAAASGTEELQQ